MKLKQSLKIFSGIFLLLVLFSVIFGIISADEILAQAPGGTVKCADGQAAIDGKCPIRNPARGYLVEDSDFPALLRRIIQILLSVAGAIAVIFLMVGGFQYVTAHGNEEDTEKAKKTVTGAIIGIAIIVMAYAIVAVVNELLVNSPK